MSITRIMQPPLDKNVAIAGAILHDIGKLREYEAKPEGAVYTAEGALIGHMLQGRDMVARCGGRSQTAGGNHAAVGTRDLLRIKDGRNGVRQRYR